MVKHRRHTGESGRGEILEEGERGLVNVMAIMKGVPWYGGSLGCVL